MVKFLGIFRAVKLQLKWIVKIHIFIYVCKVKYKESTWTHIYLVTHKPVSLYVVQINRFYIFLIEKELHSFLSSLSFLYLFPATLLQTSHVPPGSHIVCFFFFVFILHIQRGRRGMERETEMSFCCLYA